MMIFNSQLETILGDQFGLYQSLQIKVSECQPMTEHEQATHSVLTQTIVESVTAREKSIRSVIGGDFEIYERLNEKKKYFLPMSRKEEKQLEKLASKLSAYAKAQDQPEDVHEIFVEMVKL